MVNYYIQIINFAFSFSLTKDNTSKEYYQLKKDRVGMVTRVEKMCTKVNVDELRIAVVGNFTSKFDEDRCVKQIKEAKSSDKLFMAVFESCDLFDFGPINNIINLYGDDELKKDGKKFVQRMEHFTNNTSFARFSPIFHQIRKI